MKRKGPELTTNESEMMPSMGASKKKRKEILEYIDRYMRETYNVCSFAKICDETVDGKRPLRIELKAKYFKIVLCNELSEFQ